MTDTIIHPVRRRDLHGSVCSGRVCHPHPGGMTLDDRESSWITGRLLAGSRCLSEWPPTTNHATSNISKKADRTKAQTKQKPDKMKTKTSVALTLAHHGVFQPFVASRRLRTLTLREHRHSLTWQLKLSNTAD